MKKTLIALALFTIFAGGHTLNALAEYKGPGGPGSATASRTPPASRLETVAQVFELGQDDQVVTLTGHIVKQLGKEKYLFRDATGEIVLEIENEVMPAADFDDKTRVEITGEIDKDFPGHAEIEVTSIRLR